MASYRRPFFHDGCERGFAAAFARFLAVPEELPPHGAGWEVDAASRRAEYTRLRGDYGLT